MADRLENPHGLSRCWLNGASIDTEDPRGKMTLVSRLSRSLKVIDSGMVRHGLPIIDP